MNIFISWSGDLSHEIAKSFKDWLENVIQPVNIFLSSETDKGAVWFGEIIQELKKADFCIVCLTKDNNSSSWINFEAGAIASNIRKYYVSAILVDLKPKEVRGPLKQFQHTKLVKKDIKKLLKTINKNLEKNLELADNRLDKIIEKWWEDFKNDSERIIKNQLAEKEKADKKTEKELLEEIIEQNDNNLYLLSAIHNSSKKVLLNKINNYFIPEDFDEYLDSLTMRQAEIIRLYFGINRTTALPEQEIAVRFDIDIEEVRKILINGLKELNQTNQAAT